MLKPGTGWINVHVSKNGTFKLRNGIHQDVLGLFQDYFYRFCLYLCFWFIILMCRERSPAMTFFYACSKICRWSALCNTALHTMLHTALRTFSGVFSVCNLNVPSNCTPKTHVWCIWLNMTHILLDITNACHAADVMLHIIIIIKKAYVIETLENNCQD
jgi:hypothetical protein